MHRRRLNEVRFELALVPAGPLLVKEGEAPAPSENQPSTMKWVRSAAGMPYIPGSSLRGVLRATATQVVGLFHPAWALADQPFVNAAGDQPAESPTETDDDPGESPHEADDGQDEHASMVDDEANGHGSATGRPEIYGRAGPLERCFGSTALRGRWLVCDALWCAGAAIPQRRDGVGINRETGAAQHSIKFQFEYIAAGQFEAVLTLVNYELWQLGLVAHVLARLDAGEARLGARTRSGLGRVRLAVTGIRFDWYGAGPTASAAEVAIPSLAALAERAKLPSDYGFRDKDFTSP